MALILVSCGGGGDSDAELAASKELLKDAIMRTKGQNSVHVKQQVKFEVESANFTAETQMEIFSELTKAHVKATVDGKTNEIAVDGRRVWAREGSGVWAETQPQSLNVEPSSLANPFDVVDLIYEVDRSSTSEDGKRLIHVHAVIDTVTLKDRIKEESIVSPLSRTLSRADIYTFTIDYVIEEDTKLIRGATLKYEFFYERQHAKARVETKYESFNRPVTLPADLPP